VTSVKTSHRLGDNIKICFNGRNYNFIVFVYVAQYRSKFEATLNVVTNVMF